MTYRKMPTKVALILAPEVHVGVCSACKEYRLTENRDTYIFDEPIKYDNGCEDCFYYTHFFEVRKNPEGHLIRIKEICYECLEEQNEYRLILHGKDT